MRMRNCNSCMFFVVVFVVVLFCFRDSQVKLLSNLDQNVIMTRVANVNQAQVKN